MQKIPLSKIDAIIFDFDGVLTDNKVLVCEDGTEAVFCNRSDGLAFDYLRTLRVPIYIMSTETNSVVLVRAKKLNIPVFNAVGDKGELLIKLCREKKYKLPKVMFVGNDINDIPAMLKVGISVAVADSHKRVLEIADIKLSKIGGSGIVSEIIEEIISFT
jgi:3-deoxy-D-manno-octulosonate 8-phosphate phosphatase (KDO 8-P phosphatase)